MSLFYGGRSPNDPISFGGGIGGGLMNRPPPFMPQQPMPQMPRRMPGGPSKGGTTSIPMRRPPMQRPGGPGKGRARLPGYGRRSRGGPMPGGPGKGRGQMQQSMPFSPMMNRFNPALQRLTQGPINAPQMPMPARPSFNQLKPGESSVSPPSSIPSSPFMIQQGLGQTGQIGQVGNNPPAPPPDFGPRRTQGPMKMPPPFMPRSSGFDSRVGDGMTPGMGRIPQGFTQGPSSIPNSPFMIQQGLGQNLPAFPLNRGFYGGGITDLY